MLTEIMSGLPVIKNTTLGYNFIFVFSLKLKQSNHSHIVNIKGKSSLFLTIQSHIQHVFAHIPRTLAFSYRKPASSRVSCNSCPAQNHSNRDNLECHRQHINTSSNPSPKQHMQESVSEANAVQWKYVSVRKVSDLWSGKRNWLTWSAGHLITLKVVPLGLHTLLPAVPPLLEACRKSLFRNGV